MQAVKILPYVQGRGQEHQKYDSQSLYSGTPLKGAIMRGSNANFPGINFLILMTSKNY